MSLTQIPDTAQRNEAEECDKADPFVHLRRRFDLPGGLIYLDGNSLGALPRGVAARMGEVIRHEWGDRLIDGWWNGWLDLPHQTGARIAPLIGAPNDSVLAADSTSINLYKLAASALSAQKDRHVILSEVGNFPTDMYIMEGLAKLAGRDISVREVAPDAILDALDDTVALLTLSHIDYRTARMWDMAAINAACHAAGALCLWDLSHSAGAVTVDLTATNADMAVGCGYKFLNGGPGAPAFLYVRPDLQDSLDSPLQGWMGHQDPFAFSEIYKPKPGIGRFACGTPPILGLSALNEALKVFDDIDLPALFAKGQDLCDRFIETVAGTDGLTILSPQDRAVRGSHVAVAHENAEAIMKRLSSQGVIGDFRPPDIMRFGFSPLYCRHVDAHDAAILLRDAVKESEASLQD